MAKKIKYKNKWQPMKMNKRFWNEVLLKRTIDKLIWSKKGVKGVVLDNGEQIFFGDPLSDDLSPIAIQLDLKNVAKV